MQARNYLLPLGAAVILAVLPSFGQAATDLPWDVDNIPNPGFPNFDNTTTVKLTKTNSTTFKVTAIQSAGDFSFQYSPSAVYTVKGGTFSLTANFTVANGVPSLSSSNPGSVSITGYIPDWVPLTPGAVDSVTTTAQNLFTANLSGFGWDSVVDGSPTSVAFKTAADSTGWAAQFNKPPSEESIYLSGLPVAQFIDQFKNTAPLVRVTYTGVHTVTTVPVPAAVWLFGSALAAFSVVRRRKDS
ncbi:MAG: VPLPA-CTERM sorting domain-containing protein [Candidatus Methylumidiphilus sp.]